MFLIICEHFLKFKLIIYFKKVFTVCMVIVGNITHWFHIDQDACPDELIYIFFVQPG